MSSTDNDLILESALELANEGRATSKLIVVNGPEADRFAIRLKVSPDKPGETHLVELCPVTAAEMADKLGAPPMETMDAMLIDVAFIPKEFAGWIEYLRQGAAQSGLIKRPDDLRVILMTDREDKLERSWLDSPNVIGLLIKPLDTRHLAFLLSEALRNPYTAYHFGNIGWASTLVNSHMSREIEMETVSEYGATFKSATPFRPGSFFFLRKSIYDNAPGQCLSARVYFCEPHPSERNYFQVSVLYYGINDAFLRFVRTWIRENYAQSKAQGGGS